MIEVCHGYPEVYKSIIKEMTVGDLEENTNYALLTGNVTNLRMCIQELIKRCKEAESK